MPLPEFGCRTQQWCQLPVFSHWLGPVLQRACALSPSVAMTDDKIALRELLEKGSDTRNADHRCISCISSRVDMSDDGRQGHDTVQTYKFINIPCISGRLGTTTYERETNVNHP